MRRLLLNLLALTLGLLPLSAQKPAMDHSVYDGWKSLSRCSVPWDGPWMFYTVSPQQGDGILTVRNTVDGREWKVERASDIKISEDGTKGVCRIRPKYEETRQAKIKKKKPDQMPRDTLAILDLKTGALEKIPDLSSSHLPFLLADWIAYSKQVESIARNGLFHPIEGEQNIHSAIGERGQDYENLLNAARKAVSHGFKVYLLPNPSGIRTPDFIFERKGTFRPYDLKTITGKASVSDRLEESIGQSNRVLINLTTEYSPSKLARSIKHYFEGNAEALEVLVFKGGKSISVSRELSQSKSFYGIFMLY